MNLKMLVQSLGRLFLHFQELVVSSGGDVEHYAQIGGLSN